MRETPLLAATTARSEAPARQVGCRQPLRLTGIPLDRAKAFVPLLLVLPLLTDAGDLVMIAGDEVPPHDDLLVIGLAPEEQQSGVLERGQDEFTPPGFDAAEVTRSELGTFEQDPAAVDQHGVLKVHPCGDGPGAASCDLDLGPEQRGLRHHRRGDTGEVADEDAAKHALGKVGEGRGEVLEGARHTAVCFREDDPELRAVQGRRGRGRHFRVRDARAARHEVHLAGPHHLVHARAVAVFDLALKEPAHGLQAGMRVRWHHHPASGCDVVGAVVIDEAPRPDERAVPMRESAPDRHRAGPAERHFARMEHLHMAARRVVGGAPGLDGGCLAVAHRSPLAATRPTHVTIGSQPKRRPG